MFRNTQQYQGHQRDQGQRKIKSTENQLTIMLLLVTTLFLILMLPGYIRFVYYNFVKRDTPSKYAGFLLFYHVSHNLYFSNNGINFLLYCISGQKFHNDLKEILSYSGRVCGHSDSDTSIVESKVTEQSTVTEINNISQSSFVK